MKNFDIHEAAREGLLQATSAYLADGGSPNKIDPCCVPMLSPEMLSISGDFTACFLELAHLPKGSSQMTMEQFHGREPTDMGIADITPRPKANKALVPTAGGALSAMLSVTLTHPPVSMRHPAPAVGTA